MPLKLVRHLPLVLIPFAIQVSSAERVCSNNDLFGLYGFSATGRIFPPADAPITGPFARAGYATIDGAYQVKPDCPSPTRRTLAQRQHCPAEQNLLERRHGRIICV